MERISCFMICLWALFFKTLGQIDENKVTRLHGPSLNYSKTHGRESGSRKIDLRQCEVHSRDH